MSGIAPHTSDEIKIQSAEVPTYFIDGAVGSARANGVYRILCAQFAVNPDPEAKMPNVQHVLNIIIPATAVPALIEFLKEIPDGDE